MGATFFSRSGRPLGWPELEIAAGLYPGISGVHKFGFNALVGTTEESIWDEGGLYAHPSAATVMTVSSDDVNDAAAGTGARTIQLFGLNVSGVETSESVTLNGTSGVNTSTFLRVNRAIVTSAGSGEAAAGNIYIGTGTITTGKPANVFAKISTGEDQTLMAVSTIPAELKGYMVGLHVGSQGNATSSATVRLKVRPNGQVFQTKDKFLVSQAGGPVDIEPKFPPEFSALSDIEIRAASSSGTVDVFGYFEMVYVNR